jgi:oxygen-independent coproporphyrinogen-3 oxidase
MLNRASQPIANLYVHVPFCARKCGYCAFYSEVGNTALIERYVAALIREVGLVSHDLQPRTVFFGGGTPSLLNLRQWERILQALAGLDLGAVREWTVECNPASVSIDQARLLRAHGVDRVSLGVQSLNEDLLGRLGRVHNRAMVFKSFDLLRAAGFENINLDLMFAIPGQTRTAWRETLTEAIALGSEHLSSYEVTYEEDTTLFAQLETGQGAVDEELACCMYEELLALVAAGGYRQYEVSNFAKHSSPTPGDIPDQACQHNVNYWRGGWFYGLGPSATSYVRGVRTKNRASTRLYCAQLGEDRRAIEFSEELGPLARAGETAAFGLRMNAGWPFNLFQQTTDYDLRVEWAEDMERLVERGWGRRDDERFQLTDQGLRFADAAAEHFLR